ncbi:MAG: DUF302 domain-containing protein [Halothiobacillaceae bacterium]
MSYYHAKTLPGTSFDDAVTRATAALKEQGFGILTEINVTATMKQKLDRDFRNYLILGACNPAMAWEALQAEDRIGTMLPCNVIVQQHDGGDVEVAAVDPVASMQAVANPQLTAIATKVRDQLRHAIDSL